VSICVLLLNATIRALFAALMSSGVWASAASARRARGSVEQPKSQSIRARRSQQHPREPCVPRRGASTDQVLSESLGAERRAITMCATQLHHHRREAQPTCRRGRQASRQSAREREGERERSGVRCRASRVLSLNARAACAHIAAASSPAASEHGRSARRSLEHAQAHAGCAKGVPPPGVLE